jgi:hypothetical protein
MGRRLESRNMKYRAIVVDAHVDGHGFQAFFTTRQQAIDWAAIMLTQFKKPVAIYRISETLETMLRTETDTETSTNSTISVI